MANCCYVGLQIHQNQRVDLDGVRTIPGNHLVTLNHQLTLLQLLRSMRRPVIKQLLVKKVKPMIQ